MMAGVLSKEVLRVLDSTITKWKHNCDKLHILLLGKTGVGKSTLVNGLIGGLVQKFQLFAVESDNLEPTTTDVDAYMEILSGVKASIFDSPGLQDGTTEDQQHIDKMKVAFAIHGEPDIVLYCIKMDDERLRPEDLKAIQSLTEALGPSLWERSVFTLTFANRVLPRQKPGQLPVDPREFFERRIVQWEEKVADALNHANVPKDVCEKIPVIPAGDYYIETLPDRDHWVGALWLACFLRTKQEAQPSMIKFSDKRLSYVNTVAGDNSDRPYPAIFINPEMLDQTLIKKYRPIESRVKEVMDPNATPCSVDVMINSLAQQLEKASS